MVFQKPEHTGPGDRIMVCTAHPDDAEFMAGGTLAKWAREGREIIYVLATSGDKGTSDPAMKPTELAVIREAEQLEVARIIGAKHVEFLRYPDGMLENTIDLRKAIVRMIRKHKPSAVVTQDPTVRWMGNYINHPDHRAVGDATLDAVFPSARDYHMFPELVLNEGLQPHIVDHLYLGARFDGAEVFFDIAATVHIKAQALKAHKSQIPDPNEEFDEFVRSMARRGAGDSGYEHAEGFKYFYLGPDRPRVQAPSGQPAEKLPISPDARA